MWYSTCTEGILIGSQAVDNVLERFLVENARVKLLQEDQILRVATESSKVNKNLQKYTIDARVGGSLIENPKLLKLAQKRVLEARIVFTTCTGAGLGMLRKAKFGTVLIDEASQVTEPCALIPLVKGCERAVLVGDQYVESYNRLRAMRPDVVIACNFGLQ